MAKFTTEDFINKARKIHGEKYDYSKVEYINSQTKVIIICPEHGEFEQTPSDHLSGSGCQKCGKKYMDTNYFIEKAQKIHGNKYSYLKTKYVSSYIPIIITCQKHGDFKQNPNGHLDGNGCPKCSNRNIKYTNEDFINKAREVHGDRYNYDKVNYVKSNINIIINCSKHGDYLQKPSAHLSGRGCSKCKIDSIKEYYSLKRKAQYLLLHASEGESPKASRHRTP